MKTQSNLRYFCIMPNAWGKGNTAWLAMLNAKRQYSWERKVPTYIVIFSYPRENDEGVYITDFGEVYGSGLEKVYDSRTPRKLSKTEKLLVDAFTHDKDGKRMACSATDTNQGTWAQWLFLEREGYCKRMTRTGHGFLGHLASFKLTTKGHRFVRRIPPTPVSA